MRWTGLIMAAVGAAGLACAAPARAGSTFIFNASQPYRAVSDSPFASAGGSFFMENFEDGLLNTAGLSVTGGKVKGAGAMTDSVDGDAGGIDGFGRDGSSYTSGNSKSIVFRFSDDGAGERPTAAGLVYTDGKQNSTITFKAWNAAGELIGKIKVTLGDSARNGGSLEDRFLGVMSDEGISKIKIASNHAGFEIDHVQFGYGIAVVPVPAPIALGLVGLAGVMLRGRFSRKRAE